jgi:hypothetical protein
MINEADSGSFVEFNNRTASNWDFEICQYGSGRIKAKGKRAHEYIIKNRSFETLASNYLKLFWCI